MEKQFKYGLDIQYFAAETNTTASTDLAPQITIDVATRFNGQLDTLAQLLEVSAVQKVTEGTAIFPLVAAETTLAEQVEEGEIIPLSKVATSKGDPVIIELKKYRKLTTAEAIGKSGLEHAINVTDAALVKEVYKDIRTDFLTFVGTGTGSAAGDNLQKALAQAFAQVSIKFEDDAVRSVAFINPLDLADYLGSAPISTQNAFGLRYLQDFLGFDVVLVLPAIPQGTLYATAAENLAIVAVDMSRSDIAKAFDLQGVASDFIGLTHGRALDRASIETLILSGVYITAERLDGIVKATIGSETPEA